MSTVRCGSQLKCLCLSTGQRTVALLATPQQSDNKIKKCMGPWSYWLEEEMAAPSGILAWEIPWTEEPGRLESKGSPRVRHDWVTVGLQRQSQWHLQSSFTGTSVRNHSWPHFLFEKTETQVRSPKHVTGGHSAWRRCLSHGKSTWLSQEPACLPAGTEALNLTPPIWPNPHVVNMVKLCWITMTFLRFYSYC